MVTANMKKKCEICNIELDDYDFPNHLQGKRHIKNVEADNWKKEFLEKSIYVSRMPPGLTLDDVIGFFTQFGIIERCKLEPHFAIVEFKNKDPVNFLLNKPIWMGKYKLDIKKRKWNNSSTSTKQAQNNPEKEGSEIVFADLKTKLQSQTTLDDEISTFLNTVQQPEEEVDKNWQAIHSSLLNALQPAFPKCEIIRFGSSITGLCFKDSDIDVYLNIGQPIYEDDEKNVKWTPRTVFKEVKCSLYTKKNVFERIIPIPKAKTPIIKFCHAPTSTNCDISFKNGLGVINSQLIKQLLCLDVRLKPLMLIIKFWAKTFDLSGCGKLTNYAIIMLTIFYLQQPGTSMLPPIVELQKSCEPVYHSTWQVNFDRQAKFDASKNESSITELLAGFFKFYNDFPFEDKLISPLDGFAHSRTDFARVCAEKGGDTDYLALDRPICLQDPIELDHNVTCGVGLKLLKAFQKFCSVGIEVCNNALKNRGKPFVLDLYTTLPPLLENQTTQSITISVRKTIYAGVPDDFDTRTDITDKKKFIENNWYALTQRLVEDALKRVFKIDTQTIKSDRQAKQQKVAETSDVHSKDNDKILLECTSYYCVIAGRKSNSHCLDPALSPIDKEALISEELIKKQVEEGVRPTKIQFMCTIIREENPLRLVLQLTDRNSAKKRFRPFAAFLKNKLPSIIDKELSYIIQYNKKQNL